MKSGKTLGSNTGHENAIREQVMKTIRLDARVLSLRTH